MLVLAALNTYCVDVMQKRSSEVIAINKSVGLRLRFSLFAQAFPHTAASDTASQRALRQASCL